MMVGRGLMLAVIAVGFVGFGLSAKKSQLKLKNPTTKTDIYKSTSGNNFKNSGSNISTSGRSRGKNAVGGKSFYLEADSILFEDLSPKIEFSGFEKPFSSRKESFLITNSSPLHIRGVEVKISYFDLEGRMLNSREETFLIDIPSSETRHVSVDSFDKQSFFYHVNSKAPKTGGQPFNVKINPIRIFIPK